MPPDPLEPLAKYSIGTKEFKQGQLLNYGMAPLRDVHLTVVRSGSIEIFERAKCMDIYAYRPVTIFREGSMFGLFDLMDSYCGLPRLYRGKEQWEIAAGRGATLTLGRAHSDLVEEMYQDTFGLERWDKKGHFEPRDLFEILLASEPIVLEFYEFRDLPGAMRECSEVFDAIVRSCWASAQEYRLSRNLYNQGFYDAIYNPVRRELGRGIWQGLGNVPGKDTLVPEIIYTAIEALERPALNNPMFYRRRAIPRVRRRGDAQQPYDHLDLNTVLRAFHPEDIGDEEGLDTDMYYPLGIQNLSINRFLSTRYKLEGNTEAAGNLKTFFNPARLQRPGDAAPTDKPKGKDGSGHDGARGPARPPRYGLKDILVLVVKHFKLEYARRKLSYPFEVQVRMEAVGGDRCVPLLLARRLDR